MGTRNLAAPHFLLSAVRTSKTIPTAVMRKVSPANIASVSRCWTWCKAHHGIYDGPLWTPTSTALTLQQLRDELKDDLSPPLCRAMERQIQRLQTEIRKLEQTLDEERQRRERAEGALAAHVCRGIDPTNTSIITVPGPVYLASPPSTSSPPSSNLTSSPSGLAPLPNIDPKPRSFPLVYPDVPSVLAPNSTPVNPPGLLPAVPSSTSPSLSDAIRYRDEEKMTPAESSSGLGTFLG